MYALIENNSFVKFVTLTTEYPNISFPSVINENDLPTGIVSVLEEVRPAEQLLKRVDKNTVPTKHGDGKWYLGWTVSDITGAERTAEIETFKINVISRAQFLLDNFAQSRGYDGILSTCSYANSTITSFQTEANRCIVLRDSMWTTLNTYLTAVETSAVPFPASLSEVEAIFPALTW